MNMKKLYLIVAILAILSVVILEIYLLLNKYFYQALVVFVVVLFSLFILDIKRGSGDHRQQMLEKLLCGMISSLVMLTPMAFIVQTSVTPFIEQYQQNQILNSIECWSKSTSSETSNNSINIVYNFTFFNHNETEILQCFSIIIPIGMKNIFIVDYTPDGGSKPITPFAVNPIIFRFHGIDAEENGNPGKFYCNIELSYEGAMTDFEVPEPTITIGDTVLRNFRFESTPPITIEDNLICSLKCGGKKCTITSEYMDMGYNFTVLNNNNFNITQNLSFNIIFYLDNINVTYNASNIPMSEQSITNNSIYFVWDYIPGKINNTPGAIYFTIFVYRIPIEEGTRTISDETMPIVRVMLEEFGEIEVDKEGFF